MSARSVSHWSRRWGHSLRLAARMLWAAPLLLGLAFVRPAFADGGLAVVDQANGVEVHLYDNIQILGPVGQEFTPAFSGLDAVDLMTQDFAAGNGRGSQLQVNIRSQTIDGPLVARSSVVALPDGFDDITHFTFPDLVALIPARLYVIEIVVLSGDGWSVADNWAVGSGGGPVSTYSGGTWIIQGKPQPGNDLWFREGFANAVPLTKDYCKDDLWSHLTRADGSPFANQGVCIGYVNTGR